MCHILPLVLIVAISGCGTQATIQKTTANQKLCKLKISLDSTFDFKLIESQTLLPANIGTGSQWMYDSASKTVYQLWNSLPAGDYSLKIQTAFAQSPFYSFKVVGDTSLQFTNNLNYRLTEVIEQQDLFAADTIELFYTSNGCFHEYFEKTLLTKASPDSCYMLQTRSNTIWANEQPFNIKKKVSVKVISALFALQKNSNDYVIKPKKTKKGTIMTIECHISTTRQDLFVLAENKLYKFCDSGIKKEWHLYDSFRKNYISNPPTY